MNGSSCFVIVVKLLKDLSLYNLFAQKSIKSSIILAFALEFIRLEFSIRYSFASLRHQPAELIRLLLKNFIVVIELHLV